MQVVKKTVQQYFGTSYKFNESKCVFLCTQTSSLLIAEGGAVPVGAPVAQ